jgi:hypothetical protein
MLTEASNPDPDLTQHPERRVVADVADRRVPNAGAQGIGEILDIRQTDPEDPLEAHGLRAANNVIEVQAVRLELLADPERLVCARHPSASFRRPSPDVHGVSRSGRERRLICAMVAGVAGKWSCDRRSG